MEYFKRRKPPRKMSNRDPWLAGCAKFSNQNRTGSFLSSVSYGVLISSYKTRGARKACGFSKVTLVPLKLWSRYWIFQEDNCTEYVGLWSVCSVETGLLTHTDSSLNSGWLRKTLQKKNLNYLLCSYMPTSVLQK